MTKQKTLNLMKLAFPILLLIGRVPIAMTLLVMWLLAETEPNTKGG